ncbi:cytochrome b/b6 domain-containing protein [Paradesulfitobacterium aromaticivorans]
MYGDFLHKPKQSQYPRKQVFKELRKSQIADQVIPFQPLTVRIFHWGFALGLVMIILTGFELHSPFTFLAFNYGRVFEVHMTFAWLSLAFAALRLVDAIVRKDASLVPKLSDFKGFLGVLAYYFFLRDSLPPGGKYNSGQKIIFFSWFVVFAVASLLGIASYFMDEHLVWVWRLLGGWQAVRWVKYATAIYFSATILVHVYLSFTEDLSRLQAMITGYERRER